MKFKSWLYMHIYLGGDWDWTHSYGVKRNCPNCGYEMVQTFFERDLPKKGYIHLLYSCKECGKEYTIEGKIKNKKERQFSKSHWSVKYNILWDYPPKLKEIK